MTIHKQNGKRKIIVSECNVQKVGPREAMADKRKRLSYKILIYKYRERVREGWSEGERERYERK